MISFFWMEAAVSPVIHPMSDLSALESVLDEMEQRRATSVSASKTPQPAAAVAHDAIWDRVNGKQPNAEGVPVAGAKALDVEGIWRRYNGAGPDPSSVMEK